MMDFSARVTGCKFFSKIDLRKGYFQIFMHPDDIPKTAIITPFGLFEFLRLPFGLRNAGSTFQRMMDRVLAGLPFVFVYLDDIIVASKTLEQHEKDVEEVFRRLRSAGLVINGEKCEFAVREVQFLGHHVTEEGIRPLPDRVAAVQNHPKPSTVKQLQAFLGVVNFYRCFVLAAAKILWPLTDSLKGGLKATAAVVWTPEMEKAFADAKAALCKTALLAHPQQGWELALMVMPLRTVLEQHCSRGHLHPLHGSPWHFSQGSWSQHKLDILHLIENFLPVVLASDILGIC
jgi:hypothetical protein